MVVPMGDGIRWLDADEQIAWRSLLEGWSRLQHRLDRELKAEHDITLEDYEILVFLADAPDLRLRMSELAECLRLSRSRLTYRVDRLEGASLVHRVRCPQDGRSIWAVLTDAGHALLDAAAPGHVTAVRELLVDHFDRDEWLTLGRRFRSVSDDLG